MAKAPDSRPRGRFANHAKLSIAMSSSQTNGNRGRRPIGVSTLRQLLWFVMCAWSWGVLGAGDAWVEAIDTGDVATLRTLLEQNRDIDMPGKRGKTALMLASARGDPELARGLLELGADPNRFNQTGGTALMYAAQYNRIDIVQLLIARGAQVNAQGGKYWSALMIAVLKGHTAMVETLLAGGADPNLPDMLGATPLIRAVERGHDKIAKRLIDTGSVEVNDSDKQGVTALHLAAAAGDLELVKLLLGRGARVDAVTADGQTPIMLAQRAGHADVTDVLRKPPLSRGDDERSVR